MSGLVPLVFAFAYSGLVLFLLAHSLRRLMPPMRAALAAFGLSAAVHGATTLAAGDHAAAALAFWGIPHLALLPVLLFSAHRQSKGRADV